MLFLRIGIAIQSRTFLNLDTAYFPLSYTFKRPVNDTIVLIERKNSKGEQKINWLNVKGKGNGFLTFNNYHYYHIIESIFETTFFIMFYSN